MISVSNEQKLDSLLAKSIEYNGEQLIDTLKTMGVSPEEHVTFSIEADNGETLASYEFTIPEKSPIIDNNQQTIDFNNRMKTCLNSWEEQYHLLSALAKPKLSTDGTIEMQCIFKLEYSNITIGVNKKLMCPCSDQNPGCCV
jgi:hypothetical protein